MITLRPYQHEALAAVHAAEDAGQRRLLMQLPTGMGKTVCFARLIADTPGRSLVLAHRDELIEQAVDKIRQVDPALAVGVVKAERHEADARVIVASVQTLARERRRADLGNLTRVVVDEAHHAAARTYREILDSVGCFDPAGPRLLGVTATPVRGDGVGLDGVFENIVYEYAILDGIRHGYLSDLRGVRVQLAGLNLDRVTSRGGDWSEGQLGEALEQANAPEYIAAAYQAHAPGRLAIVFTPTVALARDAAEALRAVGVPAEAVSGETPTDERRAMLARFHRGETRVIANAQVLTEGYDNPGVGCVIIARPTQSEALYVQMVGRGTRKYPGKADCLVIDLVGASNRHSLMTLNTLFGLPADSLDEGQTVTGAVRERAADEARAMATAQLEAVVVDLFGGRPLHWVRAGQSWLLPTRPGQFRLEPDGDTWQLIEADRAGAYIRDTGPLEWVMGQAEDLVRTRGQERLADRDAPWRSRPATAKQLQTLTKLRTRPAPGLTAGEASDLISRAIARRTVGVA